MNTIQRMHANRTPVLLAHPFRAFFLLTALYAAVLMLAWVGFVSGGLPLPLAVNPFQWHSHELLFGMVSSAIAGFLLTAMCNWTGAPPLQGSGLLMLVLLWLAGRVAMWCSGWFPLWFVSVIDLAFLPALAIYVAKVLLQHGNHRNLLLVVMLVLLAMANLLMHLGFHGIWVSAGRMGEVMALNLICVVMVVIGGRVTPLFSANWLRVHGHSPEKVMRSSKLDLAAFLSALLMVPADMLTAYPAVAGSVALAACIINGWRLYGWHGWLAREEPLLWMLHLSMAWIPLALLLKAFAAWSVLAPSLWVHAMGAGAMGSLILAVMTRVALGHTGRTMQLPRFGVWIYIAILIAGVARIVATGMPGAFYHALMLSGAAWIAAFSLFLVLYWPILSQPRADGRPG